MRNAANSAKGAEIDIELQWLIFSIMVKTQIQLPDYLYEEIQTHRRPI